MGFAAADPNLYRYVGNNSTNLVDPTGLDSISFKPDRDFPNVHNPYVVPDTGGKGVINAWRNSSVDILLTGGKAWKYSDGFVVQYKGPNVGKVDVVQFIALVVETQRRKGGKDNYSYEVGAIAAGPVATSIPFSKGPRDLTYVVDSSPSGPAKNPTPFLYASGYFGAGKDKDQFVFHDPPNAHQVAVARLIDKYTAPVSKEKDNSVVAIFGKLYFQTVFTMDGKVIGVVEWETTSHWRRAGTDPRKYAAADPTVRDVSISGRPNDAVIRGWNKIIDNHPGAIKTVKRFSEGPYLK